MNVLCFVTCEILIQNRRTHENVCGYGAILSCLGATGFPIMRNNLIHYIRIRYIYIYIRSLCTSTFCYLLCSVHRVDEYIPNRFLLFPKHIYIYIFRWVQCIHQQNGIYI